MPLQSRQPHGLHVNVSMNRDYNSKVSSKNTKLLLKNLKNSSGGYFFAAPCRSETDGRYRIDLCRQTLRVDLPGGSTLLREMT